MSAPTERSEKDPQERQEERGAGDRQDLRENDARQRAASSADTWPTVVLLPALLLLRYLGEHPWAYWTAAALGLLGTIGAVVEITAGVRHIVHRRRPLVALWVVFCLATALVVLAIRLVDTW
ncbi:hypothetical protein V1460_33385 [Streptomyces sp. SCSIO 30461]|uniref:hypothetical protein n=1 Tax=Streptomyces sp. SCSIO 30461 TaxID=3118085 RepID=UPI0030D0BD70